MEFLFTCAVIAAISIAAILFSALHKQTIRADRAEAALARVEREIVRTVATNDPDIMRRRVQEAVDEALG